MRVLSMIAVTAAMIASSTSAFAGELPTYEVQSFPISAMQVQVLGGSGVQEQTNVPTMTEVGMPASPAQMTVLTPHAKRFASVTSETNSH